MSIRDREPTDWGILLNLAFGTLKAQLHQYLASGGFDDLGPSFGYVLRMVDQESLSLAELAAQLGISSQGALKIVAEMTDKGYVERVDDPEDGRVKRLVLTTRGKRLLGRARKFHAEYERQLAERLGQRRVADARAVLEWMVAESAGSSVERRARPF